MVDSKDHDVDMEDEYDEEEDSDFEGDNRLESDDGSESSEDDAEKKNNNQRPPGKQKRGAVKAKEKDITVVELDSGDEATIRERQRVKKKQRRKGEGAIEDDSDNDGQGWRAKTRSMRERDQEERRTAKLVTSKGSTIDVDKLFEEMNRPGWSLDGMINPVALPDPSVGRPAPLEKDSVLAEESLPATPMPDQSNKENFVQPDLEDNITIKRTYKFAGEVHTEEKSVPRSSAEAQAWLAEQSNNARLAPDGKPFRRPLRKISRFDPHYSQAGTIQRSWGITTTNEQEIKAAKLNTVEKSKMDWVAHVDKEGFKEELLVDARSKKDYMNRTDFLAEVEQRKEEAARAARLKG